MNCSVLFADLRTFPFIKSACLIRTTRSVVVKLGETQNSQFCTSAAMSCTCNLLIIVFTCLSYENTYLLTPWCRALLEKLTGLQLVKKFPAFHGTRRFITALTSVRQLSLSWASPIQSIYPQPTCWRSILILSTHLRLGLPSGLLPSGFPSKTYTPPFPHP